ncbi:hypothetical protein [Streptomyces anulatus]
MSARAEQAVQRVRAPLAPAAVDAPTGRRLWEVSEELTDVRFPLPAPA